ncbi:GIY-YIG nuclease family protein [Candidatus Woesebacteria bacterium]|nr:GIY-YIG nuclease family protein [Candidatus Woesebacteria bacterium]
MYYVYIVRCKDESLYTGVSTDINRRIRQHNHSKYGAKSVRGKRPVKLVYKESYRNKSKAYKREKEIKGWTREKKLELIQCLH